MRARYALPAVLVPAVIVVAGIALAQTAPGSKLDCDVVTSDAARLTLDCTPVTEVPPSTTVPDTSTSSSSSTSTPPTTAAPTTVAPTSTEAPTTTVAPSSTTPSSSTPPSTTGAPTSSSSPTTSVPSPTTTAPSSGVAFSEDFSTPGSFKARFDAAWSGELHAGSVWGGDINNWHGDHDMNCADPNTTARTITLPAGESAAAHRAALNVVAYQCAPGGDNTRAHLMTTANTEGYETIWFSPKQTFTDVRKVCFDVNATDEGGGRWVVVNFLTPAEIGSNPDLAFTSPDFPSTGASSQRGEAKYGVKLFGGQMLSYSAGYPGGTFQGSLTGARNQDRAPRYQRCVEDLGNGGLRLSMEQPDGTTKTATVRGEIPAGPVRVEFADDFYNPDKHCGWDPVACPGHDANGAVATNSMPSYTWHWDDIQIIGG